MFVSFGADTPLNEQLFDRLQQAILQGELRPGHKLPSSRQQALTLGISRNVVLTAYEQLIAEGYAEARVGAGTFVAPALPDQPLHTADAAPIRLKQLPEPQLSSYGERALALRPDGPNAAAPSPLYDFRYGLSPVDKRLQTLWRRTLAHCARSPQLNYGDAAGYLPLREALAHYLGHRGVSCSPEQIIVTGGSQQALDLVARVLLEPGDRVLLEDPCYQGARQVFAAAGASLVPTHVDNEGLVLPDTAAKLAYVTPSHQFPTGAVLSLSRRLGLLAWAQENDAFVLEDDYDSEYRYVGRPVPAVYGLGKAERVVYAGTFSKVLFPALRLGFLVLPPALMPAVLAAKWLTDRHSATLEQAALALFMTEGHFERHLRRTRVQNAVRRQALLDALDRYLGNRVEVTGTNAGIHALVWLNGVSPDQQDDLVVRARAADVGIYPAAHYFTKSPERVGLLLGYAALNESMIDEGIRRLTQVLMV